MPHPNDTTVELHPEEHKARHLALHAALDELVGDYISQTNRLPSKTTVMELLKWSHAQTQRPT